MIKNSQDENKEALMKRDKIHLNLTQTILYQHYSKKKEPESMFPVSHLSSRGLPVCLHMPGLLKQSGGNGTKTLTWQICQISLASPVSPTFIYHQPSFPSRNLRFGLRCWRDGSRPRQRQKIYPLAPRPPVASVAPCSPARPTNHRVNRQSFISVVKEVIIVPMTLDNPPWTAPLPPLNFRGIHPAGWMERAR